MKIQFKSIIIMDNSTLFTILGLWFALIAILMSTSKDFSIRWRWVIAAHLSPIICYGVLKIYFIREEFYLWKPKEYTWDNLDYFFHSSIFYWSLGINLFSFLFFSYGLPIIPKFFFKKLYNLYFKLYRIKKVKDMYRKIGENAEKSREFLSPINPKEEKIYDPSRNKEFEYDLHIQNKNLSILIQFLFCIIIFLPFKLMILLVIALIIVFMIFVRPVAKAVIDHEYKT